ncbi:hypothetical protein [Thalassotalea agarivorans]|uniref:Uncharacterized protein n=1 Tax=Thalassotalea agarivorans TaxID=349064 RepID=A0A1I0BK56_THASX|nr:hypothetical protein [Thalassotalea agarivorans]SET06944.1 hypothetical protein SAMN05660429_00965 [Thalassotalea agarivorans]
MWASFISSNGINVDGECVQVPRQDNTAICTFTNASETAPYQDYKISVKQPGKITKLFEQTYAITVPGHVFFSNGGRLVVFEFAEEGHPQYWIYATADVLKGNIDDMVYYFERYELKYIESLNDDGTLVFAVQCHEQGEDTCKEQLNIYTAQK